MTPLEELQAAHKRLSEMRDRAQCGPWQHTDDYVLVDGSLALITSGLGVANVTLIITLHRTIDAQLEILEQAWLNVGFDTDLLTTEAFDKCSEPNACYSALLLARAINGEVTGAR